MSCNSITRDSIIRQAALFFFLCAPFFAQGQIDFPKLSESDLPGSKITRVNYYDGSALWGYINGGADLFLEYGFDKLQLQEFEWQGFRFKVEFYRMNDPTAAYGIFSVSHYKCDRRDTLSKYICITPYQVQSAVGRYYISVINRNGTLKERELSIRIFEKLLELFNEEDFLPPLFFIQNEFQPSLETLKVYKGQLGLQNGMPEWMVWFANFSDYTIYLLPIKTGAVIVNIALIKFSSRNDINRFLRNTGMEIPAVNNYSKMKEGDKARMAKLLAENELLFAESNSSLNYLEGMMGKIK